MNKDEINEIAKEIAKKIDEAVAEAMKNNIEANAIVINQNLIKVPATPIRVDNIRGIALLPPMICGLELLPLEKGELLPEEVAFAIFEKPNPTAIEGMISRERADAAQEARKQMAEEILNATTIHGRRYLRRYLKERYGL